MIGRGDRGPAHPRLYRNEGPTGFRDVAAEAGLDRVVLAMGMGFGDIDNDGFLDIYLGTGRPDYSALMPNVLYKNVEGRRFEDVTTSSGTGHLQKGHGVSFADYDGDGDLDLFVEVGGAVPGDRANNLLFRNPGHGRHWLKVKLVGTRTNRAGDRREDPGRFHDGGPARPARSTARSAPTSSYGGSSLVEHIGLGDADHGGRADGHLAGEPDVADLPRIPADRTIEITEGAASYRVVERPGSPAATRAGR